MRASGALMVAAALIVQVSACGARGTARDNAVEPTGPNTVAPKSELSLRDYMVHVLQHNALELWDWTSHEIDETGHKVTAPQDEQEWEEAESAALTVVELLTPLYSMSVGRDDAAWSAGLEKVRAAANEAAAAALAQDYEAFVTASDKVDMACVSCHYVFAPQIEDPALKNFYMGKQQ